ncbi:MAG: hypothetical protein KAU52_02880 [Methanosarcinales archaeon]|nr:hypothetical protein [Methanosarcinales archaeon]
MNQPPDHLTEKADRYRRLLADALSKTRIVARVDSSWHSATNLKRN